MEELELLCFEIIANVGNARSLYIEAIRAAKTGDFEKAELLIKEGEESFELGHKAHANLIVKEANGEPVKVGVLLLHAEDQLMSAEGFKIIANEFIDLYKKLEDK
ncbi:PTS lactose/cellobiose transporter subunit IIA [Niameybacter massiliensis]|uniref:PTS lactose/cellobiose transporter subunit IIA n=1 Tax=Holtiella tumoricola TaxID=3018743 RepID=A0AA42J0G1_9FIRM|nr:PTS lactose/cellobiose transporter subunit IIA [Holtiella tumoricola]MDA3731314.1 PTS lactose/cellobiose transporter subunit IIA [Holtiella tumoricola]